MNGKRVLIMSAGAGMGHIRAAEALEKAFAADSRVGEVVNNDALRYTNKLFRDFYSRFYASLVKSAPNFLGWWYKTSDEPWRTDRMRHMLDRLNTKPLVKFIRSFQPHIIVCTHFMPAGIISHLIAAQRLQAHLSIVVTDFDFHAMWLSRAFHRYFVALEETRAHLEMLGLPRERITVSGIPIDPVFREPVDRLEVCRELGLDPEPPLLLLSAGALGFGPAEFMFDQLRRLRNPVQIVAVCGRNPELRARLTRKAGSRGGAAVLGYRGDMHRLMRAAHVFIGKPGGLTTSETLACGLPMCIVNPIPGQEERNSDHLLEEGIAVKCNDLTTLPFKLDHLLDDRPRLARMADNARRFARPQAAASVVETLIEDRLPPLSISRRERVAMLEAAGWQ